MDAFNSSLLGESPTSGVDSLAAAGPPASMSLLIFDGYDVNAVCALHLLPPLDGVPHLVQMQQCNAEMNLFGWLARHLCERPKQGMSFVSKVISLRIKLCVQQGAQKEGKTKKANSFPLHASLV